MGALALAGAILFSGCTEDAAAGTVTLNLTVTDFNPAGAQGPVPNAEVCVRDTANCTTTDADGIAVMMIPQNAQTALTIAADGFNPTLMALTTDDSFVPDQSGTMLSEEVGELLAGSLGIDYPPDGVGYIGLGINFPDGGGIPGTTLDLSDGTGTVFYNDENGFPTFDLMATSSFGAAGFVDVAPGDGVIEIGEHSRHKRPFQFTPLAK